MMPAGKEKSRQDACATSSCPPSLVEAHRRRTEAAEKAARNLELTAQLIRGMVEADPRDLPLQALNLGSLMGIAMEHTQKFLQELMKQ